MDLRQLNTFLTINELQSFTKAGDVQGYAQSTVTTQVQMLEGELGTRLFERLNHRISLTPEGKRFLPYAEQILRLAAEAKNVVADCETPQGMLKIGAVESLCVSHLPALLGSYRKRYPDVELALKFGTCEDFFQALRANTMDVAFILSRRITEPDLVTEIAFSEPVAVLAAPGHRLTDFKTVYPVDLTDEALILTEPGCSYRAIIDGILKDAGVRPRSVLEIGNVYTIKQLVLNGLGITFLPKTAVEGELQSGDLVSLNWSGPDFALLTQVVYHKQKWLAAALKSFLEMVRAEW